MNLTNYIVCFDISDDKNRTKVGNLLGGFGNRVQNSVFEISVKSNTQMTQLKQELRSFLEPSDSLFFYHLCANCCGKSYNAKGQRIASFPAAIVVG